MPYAQIHYPFENKERFEERFPADFIAEGLDQTRGWFYTLMRAVAPRSSTTPAFENVIVNGMVLGRGRQEDVEAPEELSGPDLVFNPFGSDALRWYMVSGQLLVGGDIEVAKDGAAIAHVSGWSSCRSGTRSTSSACTRTRTASRRRSRRIRRRFSTGTSWRRRVSSWNR